MIYLISPPKRPLQRRLISIDSKSFGPKRGIKSGKTQKKWFIDTYGDNHYHQQSHLVRQNERVHLILACILHPSTSHRAGWSYVIHGRLYFHPSMSSGSSISAALCILNQSCDLQSAQSCSSTLIFVVMLSALE